MRLRGFPTLMILAALLVAAPLTLSPARAGTAPDWAAIPLQPDPNRTSTSLAFDSQRGVIVLFGGRNPAPLAETWEYDGRAWSPVATAHTPPARFWHAMAYDSHRHRVVLFGGGDPDQALYLNDTWEYDGSDWTQVATPHSPPARVVTSMAFDAVRNRLVLVGGEAQPSGPFDDTWEYDGSDWIEVDTPHSPPPPGNLAAMAFDSIRGRSVLTCDDGLGGLATWEYDGSDWSRVVTANVPYGRWAHAVAFHEARGRIVLFGGYSPYVQSGSSLNDTWEYDGSDWTRVDTPHLPAPREQHAMAYDSWRQRVVMYCWESTREYGDLLEVLLDNGPASGGCCSDAANYVLAEDFEVTADEPMPPLTTMQLELEDFTGTFPENWDGTLSYWVYDDAFGFPNELLVAGTGVDPAPELLWSGHHSVGFDLEAGFVATPATRYWIAVHLGANWTGNDPLFWSLADSGFGELARVGDETGLSWSDSGHHLVFTLYGPVRRILVDGFESGDTGGWSTVVP